MSGTTGYDLRSNRINEQQDEPRAQRLLYAADTAHARAARWDVARAGLALVLSAGSLVAAFAHSLGWPMTVVGVAGALVVYAASSLSQKHNEVATRIQESFDEELFALPAVPEFGPVPVEETVTRLADRFRGDPSTKMGWYVAVEHLPLPYAVLICQRENLTWDWELRRRWASLLSATAGIWIVVGVFVALIFDWSMRGLFLWWFAPSLPGLTFAAEMAREHRAVARCKQQFVIELDERLATLPTVAGHLPTSEQLVDLMTTCRTYQDRVTRLRLSTARVPRSLYQRFRSKDEDIARRTAEQFRRRFLHQQA